MAGCHHWCRVQVPGNGPASTQWVRLLALAALQKTEFPTKLPATFTDPGDASPKMMATHYLLLPQPVPQTSEAIIAPCDILH